MQLTVVKQSTIQQSLTNAVYTRTYIADYVSINGYIFSAITDSTVPSSTIQLSKFQRDFLKLSLDTTVTVEPLSLTTALAQQQPTSIVISIKRLKKSSSTITIPYESIISAIPPSLPLNNGCSYCIIIDDATYVITPNIDIPTMFFTSSSPSPTFIPHQNEHIIIDTPTSAVPLFKSSFDYQSIGVGGLNDELTILFRRAFASRVIPPRLFKQLGITHVKGILLHGPPGTGKTLMAKQIGKLLNCNEPKVINGPELLSKYVGESEQNIRNIFNDIRVDYDSLGDRSPLHLIIFDEFDSIAKKRGRGSDNTGTEDRIVNQLLTMIDGVDSPNNFLIIAMTNRIDLIDEALLRPGRFEIQIEIHLPDEPGRGEIFNIHTKTLHDNNKLSSDVDIAELAKITPNYTGAEIAGIVKSAVSFALNKRIDINNLSEIDINDMQVCREDFIHALDECKPAFGVEEDVLSRMIERGIIDYNNYIKSIRSSLLSCAEQFRQSDLHSINILVHGEQGTGKSAIVAKTCIDANFNFVKVVTSHDFIGMTDVQICRVLDAIFTNASKSEYSAIVIDDVELIIKFSKMRGIYSNDVWITLLSLMKHNWSSKIMVFITTSCYEEMKMIGINDISLHDVYELKKVDAENVKRLCGVSGAEMTIKDIVENMAMIAE